MGNICKYITDYDHDLSDDEESQGEIGFNLENKNELIAYLRTIKVFYGEKIKWQQVIGEKYSNN